MTRQAPIIYWIKRLDEVITERVNKVLGDNGFTRTRWQVLNIIYEADAITKGDVFATMKTFTDAAGVDEILDGFAKEGWLVTHGKGDAAQLALTDAGKQQRETIFKLQSQVRELARKGVTDEEYMLAIDVLQRMVKNLE